MELKYPVGGINFTNETLRLIAIKKMARAINPQESVFPVTFISLKATKEAANCSKAEMKITIVMIMLMPPLPNHLTIQA